MDGFLLDLTDALTGEVVFLADLLKGEFRLVDAIGGLDDVAFTFIEYAQGLLDLRLQRLFNEGHVGCGRVVVGQDVEQTTVLIAGERSIYGYMSSADVHGLVDLILRQINVVGNLIHRRPTLVFLLELVDLPIDLIDGTDLIERQSDDTALLGNGLQNALTDPPYGIGDEFESPCLIKTLCGLE